MDFFNGKIDAQVTPASINFFSILDPSLSHDEEDSINQLLVFWSPNDQDINENDKLSKIGIVQGINNFVKNFEENDSLDYIELNNQLIIFELFEDRFQIMISINLTQVKDEGDVEYIQNDIAPISFLKELIHQGYNDFRLHNGSFNYNFDNFGKDEFMTYLGKWWEIWVTNLQLEIIENGVLKLYDGYKKANIEPPAINTSIDFKNLLIFNTNKSNYETYGLIYDHFNNLTHTSKTRLLNWLEEQDNYTLTPQSILISPILKNPKVITDLNNSEIIYDPFKLVFNTLSEVSRVSGVTAGVNAGVHGVSNGMSTINGYLPSWMGGGSKSLDNEEVGQDEIPKGVENYGFLIGKIGDEVIKKEIWLEFEGDEEKKFKMIVFKYYDYIFLSIHDDDINYDVINDEFIKIGDMLKFNQVNEKNFYFMIYDKFDKTIESNIPNIPKDEIDEINDVKYFHDLSISKTQSIILHREIIKMLDLKTDELEKLKRTKNGWWIYKLSHNESKEILIVKKWQIIYNKNGSPIVDHNPLRNKILDNSTSILGSIGKDAKLWLEDYLTKNKV